MDRGSKDIITSVLDAALLSYAPYTPEFFAKAVAVMPGHIGKAPRQPGERSHTSIISRHVQDGDVSREQGRALASTNRRSIQDAFKIIFPPEKMRDYLNHALKRFSLLDDGLREIGAVTLMPAIVPHEYGDKSHASSPMHITRSFGTEANGNFNNADLIRGYNFLRHNPEYGLAVRWLTGAMTDYAIEMSDQIQGDPKFQKLKESGLVHTLSLFGHYKALALMDGRLPVSFMAIAFGMWFRDLGESFYL